MLRSLSDGGGAAERQVGVETDRTTFIAQLGVVQVGDLFGGPVVGVRASRTKVWQLHERDRLAVEPEHLTGDLCCAIRQQKHNGRGDLFGPGPYNAALLF